MKSVKNKIIGFIMATILFICPVNIFANELLFNEKDIKSINAGANLSLIINEILNTYKGEITVDELYEAAIIGMTDLLDPYSKFLSKDNFLAFTEDTNGNIITYGFMIEESKDGNILVYHVFEGSKASSLGMVDGDVINKINNIYVKGLSFIDILEIVTLNPSKYLEVEIIRDDELLIFLLEEETLVNNTIESSIIYDNLNDDSNSVGYIIIKTIGQDTAEELKVHIESFESIGVEKIILDLRGNFGGNLDVAVEILNILLDEGTIMFIVDNANNKEEIYVTSKNNTFDEIIILVDGNTASSAEIIAATLQDNGSIVVGSTTYGKGLIQTALELPSGDFLMLTTHESLRITGEPLNNIGVTPDIYVQLPNFILQSGASSIVVFEQSMEILEFMGYEIEDKTNPNNQNNIEIIKKFQAEHNLNITGLMNQETIDKINENLYILYFETDIALETAYNLLFN